MSQDGMQEVVGSIPIISTQTILYLVKNCPASTHVGRAATVFGCMVQMSVKLTRRIHTGRCL